MEWLMVISACISCIATCVIAWYSYESNKLAQTIRDKESSYRETLEVMTKQHHQDLSDLYQAIVIATVIVN